MTYYRFDGSVSPGPFRQCVCCGLLVVERNTGSYLWASPPVSPAQMNDRVTWIKYQTDLGGSASRGTLTPRYIRANGTPSTLPFHNLEGLTEDSEGWFVRDGITGRFIPWVDYANTQEPPHAEPRCDCGSAVVYGPGVHSSWCTMAEGARP